MLTIKGKRCDVNKKIKLWLCPKHRKQINNSLIVLSAIAATLGIYSFYTDTTQEEHHKQNQKVSAIDENVVNISEQTDFIVGLLYNFNAWHKFEGDQIAPDIKSLIQMGDYSSAKRSLEIQVDQILKSRSLQNIEIVSTSNKLSLIYMALSEIARLEYDFQKMLLYTRKAYDETPNIFRTIIAYSNALDLYGYQQIADEMLNHTLDNNNDLNNIERGIIKLMQTPFDLSLDFAKAYLLRQEIDRLIPLQDKVLSSFQPCDELNISCNEKLKIEELHRELGESNLKITVSKHETRIQVLLEPSIAYIEGVVRLLNKDNSSGPQRLSHLYVAYRTLQFAHYLANNIDAEKIYAEKSEQLFGALISARNGRYYAIETLRNLYWFILFSSPLDAEDEAIKFLRLAKNFTGSDTFHEDFPFININDYKATNTGLAYFTLWALYSKNGPQYMTNFDSKSLKIHGALNGGIKYTEKSNAFPARLINVILMGLKLISYENKEVKDDLIYIDTLKNKISIALKEIPDIDLTLPLQGVSAKIWLYCMACQNKWIDEDCKKPSMVNQCEGLSLKFLTYSDTNE